MNRESAALLNWYDRHRRDLPWRAATGQSPDPYRVWLSEIMLQQTTVVTVKPYFERFLARFPDVQTLAAAPSDAVMQAWAGLGYYSRARNLHACAQAVVAQHGGQFPRTEAALRQLPGIGPYTAAAVAAIAFGELAAAVDGNVERVMTRRLGLDEPLPAARPAIHAATLARIPAGRAGDFAQALMDLGATVCTPRKPACAPCPWREDCCARRDPRGPEYFPVKVPRTPRPTRRGTAFVLRVGADRVLLRTRPPRGLLGGMAEVPGTAWVDGPAAETGAEAPMAGPWRRLPVPVRHVFTHFTLELHVEVLDIDSLPAACPGRLVPIDALAGEPLPTLMRKVLDAGLAALSAEGQG